MKRLGVPAILPKPPCVTMSRTAAVPPAKRGCSLIHLQVYVQGSDTWLVSHMNGFGCECPTLNSYSKAKKCKLCKTSTLGERIPLPGPKSSSIVCECNDKKSLKNSFNQMAI